MEYRGKLRVMSQKSIIKDFMVKWLEKVLFPNFTNKLTWAIAGAGLGIIVTPAPLKVIFYNFLISTFNLNSGLPVTLAEMSSGTADFFYGIFLVGIAVIFNGFIYWLEFKRSEREYATQFAQRVQLLINVRRVLAIEDLTNAQFRHTQEYAQVRQYLSENAKKAVDGEHTKGIQGTEVVQVVVGQTRYSGVNPFKNRVLDELSELEKKWKLI